MNWDLPWAAAYLWCWDLKSGVWGADVRGLGFLCPPGGILLWHPADLGALMGTLGLLSWVLLLVSPKPQEHLGVFTQASDSEIEETFETT